MKSGMTPSWVGTAIVATMNTIARFGRGSGAWRRRSRPGWRRAPPRRSPGRDEHAVAQGLPERDGVETRRALSKKCPPGRCGGRSCGPRSRRRTRPGTTSRADRRAEDDGDQQPVDEEPRTLVTPPEPDHRPSGAERPPAAAQGRSGRRSSLPPSVPIRRGSSRLISANTTMSANSSQATAEPCRSCGPASRTRRCTW